MTSGNTGGNWREETGIGRIPYRESNYQASWQLGKWNSVSVENSLGNRTYLYAGVERSLWVRELEHLPTSISHWLKNTLRVNSVLSMGEAGYVDSSRQRISCSSHRYLQLEVRPNAWKSWVLRQYIYGGNNMSIPTCIWRVWVGYLGFRVEYINLGVINILTKVLCFDAMKLDKMTKKERKMEKECHVQMEFGDMPTFRSWREWRLSQENE